MKNIQLLMGSLWCCLVLFQMGCTKVEDLTKDVDLEITADLIATPMGIKFSDVATGEAVEDVRLTITGEGTDRLYSIAGEANPQPLRGILNFGVERYDAANTQPISATIKAEAPGYLTTIRTLRIEDIEDYDFQTIKMVNAENLPNGITTRRKNVGENALNNNSVTVSTEMKDAALTIPTGQKFFAGATEKTGNVRVDIAHYSTTPEALEAFPGGLNDVILNDGEGNTIEAGFISAGVISIDMTIGGEEITNFSEPIEVQMAIEGMHPIQKRPYQVGDQIPQWTLDEENGQWVFESLAEVVEGDNGGLVAVFKTDHLSYFNLDFIWMYYFRFGGSFWDLFTIYCDEATEIRIASDVKNNNAFFYFVEVENDLGFYHSFQWRLKNGDTYNFLGGLKGDMGQIKIYDGSASCKGEPVLVKNISLCGGTEILDLRGKLTSEDVTFQVSAKAACPSSFGSSDINIEIPDLPVYYRDSGKPCQGYEPLGIFGAPTSLSVSRSYSTNALKIGGTYDFLIVYGSDTEYELTGIQIPTSSSSISVSNPALKEDVTVNINVDGNEVLIDAGTIQLSKEQCEIITGE